MSWVTLCADTSVIQLCDACLITLPATVDYAQQHGVCKLDSSVRYSCFVSVVKHSFFVGMLKD